MRLPCFNGDIKPIVLKPGTRIYRVVEDQGSAQGRFWAYDLPESKELWRKGFAVKLPWNKNGYFIEYLIPEGKGIPAWEGRTASQEFSEEGFSNHMLEGGKQQIFIADSRNIIPENLQLFSTEKLWSK